MKKRVREKKKKLSRTKKIILYVILGIIILLIIFNLGKPVLRNEGFLKGILKSVGLMSGGGSRVTPCGGSGDAGSGDAGSGDAGSGDALCAACVEKCGRTEFCVPSGKKICKKGGKCIDEDKKCGCDTSADCDSCTEYCKDTWGSDECYPKNPAMKKCPDGNCILATQKCKCSASVSCESSCDKCSGSPNYVCNFDTTKFTSCSGGGCCPKTNPAGATMKCCRQLTSEPAICCKDIEPCASSTATDINFNYCGTNETSCVSPDYICSSAVGQTCCDGIKYTGCKTQNALLPTCTIAKDKCNTTIGETICEDWGAEVLCCSASEKCVSEIRTIPLPVLPDPSVEVKLCLVKSCTPGTEFICTGSGMAAEIATCCKTGQACLTSPNGNPLCA